MSESVEELRQRLELAEAALEAIRGGTADALLGGPEPLVVRLKSLEEETARYRALLDATSRLKSVLLSEEESEVLIKRAVACLVEPLLIRSAWIALTGEEGRVTHYAAAGQAREAGGASVESAQPPCLERLLTEERLVVFDPDDPTCPDCPHPARGVRCTVGVRLACRGRIYGALAVEAEPHANHDERTHALIRQAADELAFALSRLKLEEQLRRSNRLLQTALEELETAQQNVVQQERLRALGTMASGVAHDFNNALMPVLGYSELPLVQPELLNDHEKMLDYLQTMNTAARDAANVVGRLREFYRHREETDLVQPVDVDFLIAQALSLTQPKWKDQALAQGASIEVATEVEPCPPIAGVEAELREAFTNLIFNAVDAMPEGGTLTLRARPEGEWIRLEVVDTGIGMDEETRQRCLEPFFTTKGERGTGLGLGMVYGTIQRHEGEIEIESALGEGTTFSLRLPVFTEQRLMRTEAAPAAPSRPLRVLVADDEARSRELIVEYLEADGHEVTAATNGLEAMRLFAADRFDVVLTDRAMPEMNGDQLAAAIKEIAPRKPIVMITGYGDAMLAGGERPRGVDAILPKPLRMAPLREALAKAMGRAGEA